MSLQGVLKAFRFRGDIPLSQIGLVHPGEIEDGELLKNISVFLFSGNSFPYPGIRGLLRCEITPQLFELQSRIATEQVTFDKVKK